MTFRIHYELRDGTEDCVTISGDTLEDVREKAIKAVAARNGLNPWSEEVK